MSRSSPAVRCLSGTCRKRRGISAHIEQSTPGNRESTCAPLAQMWSENPAWNTLSFSRGSGSQTLSDAWRSPRFRSAWWQYECSQAWGICSRHERGASCSQSVLGISDSHAGRPLSTRQVVRTANFRLSPHQRTPGLALAVSRSR